MSDGDSFHKSNHPQNGKRRGAGLYAKESLQVRKLDNLVTLPECIVCEIQSKRKKVLFDCSLKKPKSGQIELEDFINKFDSMLPKMASKNPYCVVITDDLNARSAQLWENGLENDADELFDLFTAELGLEQLISKLTHIIGESQYCIDLILLISHIFSLNLLFMALHEECHHQIIYGKISIENLPLPPHKQKIWFHDRADVTSIRKKMCR